MRTVSLARLLLGSAVVVILGRGLPAAAPPVWDISDAAISGGLLPSHVSQIDARIRYWVETMRQARDYKTVVTSRTGLLQDYGSFGSVEFRYTFARLAAEFVTPLLELPDDIKQVNAALALSRMPQVIMQPALEKMVVHRNPAVRYLGWRGYRGVRTLLLAQGPSYRQTMFRSLGAAAARENSPLVIRAIFGVLRIPAAGAAVPEDVRSKAQEQAFVIFQQIWPSCCRRVLAGNAVMAEASQEGLAALLNFAPIFGAQKANSVAILQMVVEMTWCSAMAYDQARASGPIAAANTALLRECEKALNNLKNTRNKDIEAPLTAPKQPDRGSAVRLGVLEWIKLLKDDGVVKPSFKLPGDATTKAAPPVVQD